MSGLFTKDELDDFCAEYARQRGAADPHRRRFRAAVTEQSELRVNASLTEVGDCDGTDVDLGPTFNSSLPVGRVAAIIGEARGERVSALFNQFLASTTPPGSTAEASVYDYALHPDRCVLLVVTTEDGQKSEVYVTLDKDGMDRLAARVANPDGKAPPSLDGVRDIAHAEELALEIDAVIADDPESLPEE